MPDQEFATGGGDRDDVAGVAVGGFVERQEELVVDAVGVVRVIVVEYQRHSEQGSEWLGNDVRGNEVAVENVRSPSKK